MGSGYEITMIAGGDAMAVTWRGEVEIGLWHMFVTDLVDDERVCLGLGRLHDFRAVNVDFDQDMVGQMAAVIDANDDKLGRRRIALLLGGDVDFGVMRMLASMSEPQGSDVQVFRDGVAALAWVGAPDDTVLPADGKGEGR